MMIATIKKIINKNNITCEEEEQNSGQIVKNAVVRVKTAQIKNIKILIVK